MRREISQGMNRMRKKVSDYVDEGEALDWIASLYYDLELVEASFVKKGEPEQFETFIRRLVQYKTDFPGLNTSGDFALVKRAIMAEIWFDDVDCMDATKLYMQPKLIDALTKAINQLMKNIEAVGATSRQRRKEQLDALKVIVDHQGLKQVAEEEAITDEWIAEHAALPE